MGRNTYNRISFTVMLMLVLMMFLEPMLRCANSPDWPTDTWTKMSHLSCQWSQSTVASEMPPGSMSRSDTGNHLLVFRVRHDRHDRLAAATFGTTNKSKDGPTPKLWKFRLRNAHSEDRASEVHWLLLIDMTIFSTQLCLDGMNSRSSHVCE